MKQVFKEGTKDVLQVYRSRTKILRLFWNEFLAGYHRKLKFTDKWLEQFKNNIPKNTYVLVKEKNMKTGRYVAAAVVDVHRRKDGLISRLLLKTADNKNVVERNLRQCWMLEHDFLRLVEENHQ